MCAIIRKHRLKGGAIYMTIKKQSIKLLKRVVVACFFAVITLFGAFSSLISGQLTASAIEVEAETVNQIGTESAENANNNEEARSTTETRLNTSPQSSSDKNDSSDSQKTSTTSSSVSDSDNECKKSFGALGWLVCPATGKIAQAVDFLYGAIENLLIVEPIKIEDGTPIYEIWKYCRALTNIIFIIMFLVAIYSQVTGFGISNYGLKRALPKLIVAAVLINLSFIICSLLVDASNITGNGIRGLFTTIAESATIEHSVTTTNISVVGVAGGILGGSAIIIGTAYAASVGTFYLFVPIVVGMLLSLVVGLFTIALRQAVIALLVMVAPLAIIANILPNTENLFKKWKDTLTQMLIFYPIFSLLFGASNLAGFAIAASSDNIFGALLGMCVQVFPLIFSVKMMQMSNTVLGGVSSWLNNATRPILAANQDWARSHAFLKKQKSLAKENSMRPSIRLLQFMDLRRQKRELDASEYADNVKNRAMAMRARSHYRKDGTLSRKGERAYKIQAENIEFQSEVLRDKTNFDRGFGDMGRGKRQTMRLQQLDVRNMNAADRLHNEEARSEYVKYENAKGYYKRMEDARLSHLDESFGFEIDPDTGEKKLKKGYVPKLAVNSEERAEALARYNTMFQIMDGNTFETEYAVAAAAQGYVSRQGVMGKEYYTYFKNIPPGRDLRNVVSTLTNQKDAADHMDMILPGLRVLNEYGDVNIVRDRIVDIMRNDDQHNGLTLGTHASQSLANFLMFEVNERDPFLKRFGNYINGETGRVYDTSDHRTKRTVDYDEYIRGYYDEPDPDNPGQTRRVLSKKGVSELIKGTSFSSVERASFEGYEQSLRETYTTVDENGNKTLDMAAYLAKKEEIEDAIAPAIVTANMQYMTDSDQLAGSIRIKTGFMTKRDPATGKTYTVPIWEDQETLAKYGMLGHEEELRKFHQRKSIEYASALSPTQVLALRGAFREPLRRHMSDALMESDTDGWTDEEKAERQNYLSLFERAQGAYDSLPEGAEKTAAKNKVEAVREKMAGLYLRHILGETGTLTQIYDSRTSGAANNARDWLREWLHLNNLEEVKSVLNKQSRPKKKQSRSQTEPGDVTTYQPIGEYSENDISVFRSRMDNLRRDMSGATAENFYDELRQRTFNEFGDLATPALEDLERAYNQNGDNNTPERLINKLIDSLTRDLLG